MTARTKKLRTARWQPKRALGAAVFAALLLTCAGGARAADVGPSHGGFEVAFRSGVLGPLGDVKATYVDPDGEVYSEHLSGYFAVQFPLWLDLGYRFDRVFVGAYGQYAFGLPGSYCRDCSSHGVRVGFELQWHPFDRLGDQLQVDPWFGVGFGYEWATSSSSAYPHSITFQGWDFLRLGLGLDFAITNTLALGPFVEWSLGQFSQEEFTYSGCAYCVNSGQGSVSIDRKALHFWLALGLKLTWRP